MRIFAFVLFSSLVLASCGMNQSPGRYGEVPPAQISSSSTSATLATTTLPVGVSYSETLDKTSSKIKNTKEFEECMRPSVNMCVSQVGNQLARAQKSTVFCDEMEVGQSRDACKYGVVMTQVAETQDAKLCESLESTYKRECQRSIILTQAMTSGDPAKCDLLESDAPASSGAISTPLADRTQQCKADVIMRKPDAKASDCDILKDGPAKSMCQSLLKNRSEGIRTLREALPDTTRSSTLSNAQ